MPGARYDLLVEVQGRTITGSVAMPERPALRLLRGAALDTVVWAPASGAAAYFSPAGALTTDTMWIGDRQGAGTRYFVTAIDPQLARYLRSPQLTQSGVTGALGLFGAQVTVSIEALPNSAGGQP